jgi:aspartate kinase
VIKLGGSVLARPEAYRVAAEWLRGRLRGQSGQRLIVVVSAQLGETDRLEREALSISERPQRAALDLLWSTGELRSVALLTLWLERLGVGAAGLDVQQTGLRIGPGAGDAARVELFTLRMRAALTRSEVVVVPGFLACGVGDAVVALGRGGSDLTAVVLAGELGAEQCELIKDVPGYFDRDPNLHRDARHVPRLSYSAALAMAAAGCDLVQREALEAAQRRGVRLVIRGLAEGATPSVVSSAAADDRALGRGATALAAG